MSVRIMAQVWELDLPLAEKMLLLALADHANDDGVAWPGRRSLARKTGLADSTIPQVVRRLERKGLLSRKAAASAKGTNIYYVMPEGYESHIPSGARGMADTPQGGMGDIPGRGMGAIPEPSVEPSVEPSGNPSVGVTADDQAIFDAWKTSAGKNGLTVLTDERVKAIHKARRNYDQPTLLAAVQGWQYSNHHAGKSQSSQGRKWNELTLCLRDAEHIELFASLWFEHRGSPYEDESADVPEFLRQYREQREREGW